MKQAFDSEVYDTAYDALRQWGAQDQQDMAAGEIGELLALFGKDAQGRTSEEQWADEIADVLLTLPALAIMKTDRVQVRNKLEEKTKRLQEIMEDEVDHPHDADEDVPAYSTHRPIR